MYQLTYSSVARANCNAADILDILNKSQKNNKALDITGCLVYHNDCFVQILEGSKKNIIDIYNIIKNDIRHSHVKLLWKGPSEQRVFKSWNMAYYSLDDKKINRVELDQFEKNLLLLSTFEKASSGASKLFWTVVRGLIPKSSMAKTVNGN